MKTSLLKVGSGVFYVYCLPSFMRSGVTVTPEQGKEGQNRALFFAVYGYLCVMKSYRRL